MHKKEQRAKLIADMKALDELAKKEERSFTDEEQKSFDGMEAEVRKLTAEIEADERSERMNGFSTQLPKAEKPQEERKDDSCFKVEKRAGEVVLSVADGAASLAPERFVAQLLAEVEKEAILYGKVTKIPVSGAGSIGVPTEEADATSGEWTNEIPDSEISEDTSWKFGKRELAPTDLVKLIKFTKKLLAASALPIDTMVKDKLKAKMIESFEKAIIAGTGVNQPLGIFTASNDGIPTSRDLEATAGGITADDLIKLKMSLRPAYRNKASWIMSTEILTDLMLLKDKDGQYIYHAPIHEGEYATLLGLPVIESEYAPSAKTNGAYVIVLGDMSKYWFAYWKGIELNVANEKFIGTNQIGVYGHTLADGEPVQPAAFARLKYKTA